MPSRQDQPRDPLHEHLRREVEATLRDGALGQWMQEHRDELERMLRRHASPPWNKMAEDFERAGLLRRADPDMARATWQAVERMRAGRTSRKE